MTITLNLKWLKACFLKEEGKISVSKMLIWLTGVLAIIAELNTDLTAMGITIPAKFVPYIKDAAILSALLTAFRLRFGIGKNSASTTAPAAPTAPEQPTTTSTPPVPPANPQ